MTLTHYTRERMASHARRLRRLAEKSTMGDTLTTSAKYIEGLLVALAEAEGRNLSRPESPSTHPRGFEAW